MRLGWELRSLTGLRHIQYRGQTPEDECKEILAFAVAKGIEVIDTAAQYGQSEQLLGDCLPPQAPCES